jgi:hypothetical protein
MSRCLRASRIWLSKGNEHQPPFLEGVPPAPGRVPIAVGQWMPRTPVRAVDIGPLDAAMRVEAVRPTSVRAGRRLCRRACL